MAELYDWLREAVVTRGKRDVRYVRETGLLGPATFHEGLLPDDAAGRAGYFGTFWLASAGCDLVFFDPDNGLEVRSKPYGRRGSSKYLYWTELTEATARGHAVLVYQHFRRVKRDRFIAQMVRELCSRTGYRTVYTFRTARVVFLLLLDQQEAAFEGRIERVERVWAGQFGVLRHACAAPPWSRRAYPRSGATRQPNGSRQRIGQRTLAPPGAAPLCGAGVRVAQQPDQGQCRCR